MNILAIETSCDETAIALVECSGGLTAPKFRISKDALASQIKVHRPFGGVVPNLAKREHLKNLPILFRKLFGKEHMANSLLRTIDLIAVTVGPGLEPALWTGIEFAKQLRKELYAIRHKPLALVGANHLEGHLYSFLLSKKTANSKHEARNSKRSSLENSNFDIVSDFGIRISDLFPAVGLVVSGGHTTLMLLKNLETRKKLGETRDDAAGEAFDKVARILGLPYPGGPEIEKIAAKGDPNAIPFPRPMMHHQSYDFSFSGLKTAVFYYLRDNPGANKADVAASFQEAAVDVLAHKTMRAAREFSANGGSASGGGAPVGSILLSGGVAANRLLRERLTTEAKRIGARFLVAEFKHNTDNAVMIAVAAYINYLKAKNHSPRGPKAFTGYRLTARGDMNIS